MKPLIIHHASCPDGFGAAYWLGKRLGDHDKYAANWNEPPPDVAGRDVYVVDFCYPPIVLSEMVKSALTLLVLDHHQTSAEWASALREQWRFDSVAALEDAPPQHFAVVIDQTHSGVGLVLEYCDTVGPAFYPHLEDRDLWRFALPDTADVFAAVTSRPYTVEAWDEMSGMALEDLVTEGRAINRYREQLIASCVENAIPVTFGGHKGYGAPAPYMIGSDVAGILAARDGSEFGAYWIDRSDHRQWGLRSKPDGLDVAKLAEAFGGGGHVHASGFRLPL